MGDYIRRATERMLEDEYPELAKEIQTVREKHRLAARVMVTRAAGAVLLGFFLYVASHSPEMRRPRRRDEIVNVEDGEQVEVA